jgi:hypothetical protein
VRNKAKSPERKGILTVDCDVQIGYDVTQCSKVL